MHFLLPADLKEKVILGLLLLSRGPGQEVSTVGQNVIATVKAIHRHTCSVFMLS